MTFRRKLWMTFFIFILVTVGAAFGLAYTLYEKLYVESVKEELAAAAEKLSFDYNGGELDPAFIEQVNWFSEKSPFQAFAVHNPRELAACIPYEADYQTLIGPEERARLLENHLVEKSGYSTRFDRQIISVIYPLLDDKQLMGIIYVYVPLERIDELVSSFLLFWLSGALFLIALLLYAGVKWASYVTKPLQNMQQAAVLLSKGNYKARVPAGSQDEFGQLARTFNEMASAIEQEDEQRKLFLATVSHELRTPLSYIKGYSEAAIRGIGSKEKQLAVIYRESIHMERIVNDLLDLIRFDSGSIKMEKIPLPLADLVYSTIETFQLKHTGFRLKVNEELIAYGDEGRLRQVMTNILDNAIRYSNEDDLIYVTLKEEDGKAKWVVQDSGPGIAEEELPKVTDRFYRVNKARTRNDGGAGLGLSIVKQIIELHNGELYIESKAGAGTTVIVSLPLIE